MDWKETFYPTPLNVLGTVAVFLLCTGASGKIWASIWFWPMLLVCYILVSLFIRRFKRDQEMMNRLKKVREDVRNAKSPEELDQIKKRYPDVKFVELNKQFLFGDKKMLEEQLKSMRMENDLKRGQQQNPYVKFTIMKKEKK
ncbi:MAG: hypothetical protein NT051_04450 [Candidatus Micrarchaeota archaeon]|nr:hypothetical protein [Candidatus Micrarchaeota archaeon]